MYTYIPDVFDILNIKCLRNHFSVLDPAFMVSAGQLRLCTSPCFLFVYTCVMEPPGFVDGMSGGGSVMVSGLTAASRPLSCGRPGSDGWPPCWKAGEGQGQVGFAVPIIQYTLQLRPYTGQDGAVNSQV